jgi:hypothetical protein
MLSRLASWQIVAMLWSREVRLSRRRAAERGANCFSAPTFRKINTTDVYHEKWWYTSQLFDPDWTPRDTLEHAPPAGRSIENVA